MKFTSVIYFRMFERDDYPGCGFSFECDADGNVNTLLLPSDVLNNWLLCITNSHRDFRVTEAGIMALAVEHNNVWLRKA